MNPEGTAANGLRWRAVAVLAPLIIAAYHWRAALPGMAFAGSDLRFFFYAGLIHEGLAFQDDKVGGAWIEVGY